MTALLLLALAAGEFEPDASERAAPRFHGDVSVGGAFVFALPAYPIFRPSLHVELGLVFGDHLLVSVRGDAATVFLGASAWIAGVSFAERLDDHFALGGGLTFARAGGIDGPAANAVLLPIRLTWTPRNRDRLAVWRHGLTLSVELTPGLTVAASGGPAFFPAVATQLGVGYALW